MRGLVTRLRRRRPADPVPIPPVPPGPAGLEPQDPVAAPEPSFRDRGRLRRRLRHLRRVRELGFRDLGGLVFDLHRFGRSGEDLVAQKLNALAAVDGELRALERALDDVRPLHELREPGLAACPRCAAIHGSDARFCPSCGTSLRGPRVVGEVGDSSGPPGSLPVTSPAADPPTAHAGAPPATATPDADAAPTQALPRVPAAAATETSGTTSQRADAGPDASETGPTAPLDDATAVRRRGDSEA